MGIGHIASNTRSGKPGAVQLKTLKQGDRFSYDTIDATARASTHEVARVGKHNVMVNSFCDPRISTFLDFDTWVFPVES